MPRVVPSQAVELIEKLFPRAKDQLQSTNPFTLDGKHHLMSLATIIEVYEQIPSELIHLSSERYMELISAVAAIKIKIEEWKFRSDTGIQEIPGLEKLNPINLIYRALTECPDEFPSVDTTELLFIKDDEFRINIEIDISTAYKAHSNGEWKAATILAGSVIEALLFWKLNEYDDSDDLESARIKLIEKGAIDRKSSRKPENWYLHIFIEVSEEIGIISDVTADSARIAKGFRNLIHPGREARLNQKCNRATSLSALAAVEHVIKDFKEYSLL